MRWMWIDRIVAFEPHRRLSAIKNVSLAEEHLHDHFPAAGDLPALPVMPASLVIEGMAQTAGILVGSTSSFTEKVVLAKISRAALDADVVPGQTLLYMAELERVDDQGAATLGTVSRADHGVDGAGAWEVIGRIDLMFSHLDRSAAGLAVPAENFVFAENFRCLLAGLRDGPSGGGLSALGRGLGRGLEPL